MKPGDLVQITFRRRRSMEPLRVGVLLEIRRKEYPLRGERDLDYIILVDGKTLTLSRRYLKPVE